MKNQSENKVYTLAEVLGKAHHCRVKADDTGT